MSTTARNAPGKHYRKGYTLIEAVHEFADDAKAEQWLVNRRWPDGIHCPDCDSVNIGKRSPRKGRKTPEYRCNSCKMDFTVKTGTILHDSKLPLGKWVLAFFLYSTSLKSVSSMKLHRDLGITQKAAWHLAHRIRETWNQETNRMAGEVEADEAYFGGKESNKHADKKLHAGRGAVGKTPVAGLRSRETNHVKAEVVEKTDGPTLRGFVHMNTTFDSTVYTDEAPAYLGLNRKHEAVKHSAGEYVRGKASTNGLESFWAQLKRGHDGTFHHFSHKHLNRYVREFAGRHNSRPLDTGDMMGRMATGAVGKQLPYADLIGPQGTRMGRGL